MLNGSKQPQGSAAESVWKIQQTLEAAGVELCPEEAGKGAGVRLRQARDSRF
jgi:hypothetical protein